jgi:hypothetical protein
MGFTARINADERGSGRNFYHGGAETRRTGIGFNFDLGSVVCFPPCPLWLKGFVFQFGNSGDLAIFLNLLSILIHPRWVLAPRLRASVVKIGFSDHGDHAR